MKRSIPFFLALLWVACQPAQEKHTDGLQKSTVGLSQDFKSYWFDGTAEISSYVLQQSRYGALREGTAVLIYVTEDFLTDTQVKANQKSKASRSVLKLNRQKNFLTGIYPYSIMSSCFTYLGWEPRLAKTTASLQEWCGQSYLQLNQKNQMVLQSHSYFEGEADQKILFPKETLTEDELWNRIRLHPEQLPTGAFQLLPSLELLRLNHWPLETVAVRAQLIRNDGVSIYTLRFPSLKRSLSIRFQTESPHRIEGWEDRSDRGADYTTTATRLKTEKLPYWKLNRPGDEQYRSQLQLPHKSP